MTTIRQLLAEKGSEVLAIGPDETVLDAITMMAEHDVGALVVLKDGKLIGIFTERHYARNVLLKGRSSPKTKVSEAMSPHVICVAPAQTVEECMAIMSDRKVRHLPVISVNEVIGIVSIGDLVKSIIGDQKFVIEQLEQFISR
ncbi:MAG TPA: CBS domain-containing protein [Roseovarius sp.]